MKTIKLLLVRENRKTLSLTANTNRHRQNRIRSSRKKKRFGHKSLSCVLARYAANHRSPLVASFFVSFLLSESYSFYFWQFFALNFQVALLIIANFRINYEHFLGYARFIMHLFYSSCCQYRRRSLIKIFEHIHGKLYQAFLSRNMASIFSNQ